MALGNPMLFYLKIDKKRSAASKPTDLFFRKINYVFSF